jgi:hypothetical protein
VEGDVHFPVPGNGGTVPLMVQGLIPVEGWVDLGAASRLVAKDPRTTRETAFRGPAHIRTCVAAAEESWVASGVFESAVGAGETPGAEEWVATPLALVRYASSKVTVDVRSRSVGVKVAAGVVYVWVAGDARSGAVRLGTQDGGSVDGGNLIPGASDEGWARMGEGQAADIAEGAAPGAGHHMATPEAAAQRAVAACETFALGSEELATLVLHGGADASAIRSQVSTRRRAHAACSVASVRVHSLPESDMKGSLLRSMASATGKYEGLPLSTGDGGVGGGGAPPNHETDGVPSR